MTREQYERWKDFSRRMVAVAVSHRKRVPSRAMVLESIDFFFDCRMEPDVWQRVRDWDHTEPTEKERSQWPRCAMSVSSHIDDLEEEFIPGYWSLDTDRQFELARERWVDPVHRCIRAGLDVAVAPSAGVAGFTAGDIRAMYPEGVPEWVSSFFKPGLVHDLAPTTISGIYLPVNERFDERPFHDLPDSEPVWL